MVAAALLAAVTLTACQQEAPAAPRPDVASMHRQALWNELQPVALTNCQLERYGEEEDGGYLVCGNLLRDVKAGYSYGISGYDGWGCEVATTLGVPVHQYDCFDTRAPQCGGKTTFHAECIAGFPVTTEGRVFETLEHQLQANGHGDARIVMKIDVEGAEWDVFLASPDAVLDRIDQLVVEFHGTSELKFLAAVQRLKDRFHVANLHMNNNACDTVSTPFPAWAYEVLFVNKRLDTVAAPSRATPYHALDRPNTTRVADCQPRP